MAISRLAQVQTPARDRPRQHSLAHARVEWADGTVREGWLKVGEDGMTVTVAVAAEVAARLARGEGKSGAFTPAELFGPALALSVGREFIEARA